MENSTVLSKRKIAVVGGKGKMGSAVCRALAKDYEVVVIGRQDKLTGNISLVIDFGTAESSVISAIWCKENNVPLIIGSTGQTDAQMKTILDCSKFVPILKSDNFSFGLVLFKKALKTIISRNAEDVIIFEKHHREKKDSPSGTAINLKQHIQNFYDKNIQTLSLRGGKEIGTHTVDCYFENEMLSISHKAFSRDAFADGVAVSADWMLKAARQNRLYSFDEICEEKEKG